jgi:hypothetical protein
VRARVVLSLILLAACSSGAAVHRVSGDPPRNEPAKPDYTQACAPSGLDGSQPCVAVTLDAVDNARASEHVVALEIPADYGRLSVPIQLFIAIDAERVDRGLPPFTGLTAALSAVAQSGADLAQAPPDPGSSYADPAMEWIGAVSGGLDADYEWVYDDGPGAGVPGCGSGGGSGCWNDRHALLGSFRSGTLVMGAAVNPTADTGSDKGGPSVAVVVATTGQPGSYVYTWAQAQADIARGTLRPTPSAPANQSATGIADPAHTVPASPDYTQVCAPSGIDSSPACLAQVLAAVDHARTAEGIAPMNLPAGYAQLSVPQQVFVAVNLERADRGLPTFTGLTDDLDHNAQIGADDANDPPDPGSAYTVDDSEWAGGSVNGLDAVYGWMYDDGIGSGNLDCPAQGGTGCWDHRHGILDNFGSVGQLVMGAAVNPTGDRTSGDKGGPSIAATLAITTTSPGRIVYPT